MVERNTNNPPAEENQTHGDDQLDLFYAYLNRAESASQISRSHLGRHAQRSALAHTQTPKIRIDQPESEFEWQRVNQKYQPHFNIGQQPYHHRHVSAEIFKERDPIEKTPHFDQVPSKSYYDAPTFALQGQNPVRNGWAQEAEMAVHRRVSSNAIGSDKSIEAIVTTKNDRREKNRQKA
jgi:hypothetical protein